MEERLTSSNPGAILGRLITIRTFPIQTRIWLHQIEHYIDLRFISVYYCCSGLETGKGKELRFESKFGVTLRRKWSSWEARLATPEFHSGSVPYYHLNFHHNPPFLGLPMARGITVADTALQVRTHLQCSWPTILSSHCPLQPNDLPPELSATKCA